MNSKLQSKKQRLLEKLSADRIAMIDSRKQESHARSFMAGLDHPIFAKGIGMISRHPTALVLTVLGAALFFRHKSTHRIIENRGIFAPMAEQASRPSLVMRGVIYLLPVILRLVNSARTETQGI